ncbi:MAG: endolytic transglycosylase MltG, partial [Clostridia bacterium]|nr:endolytic transglycosylase MltG [Clostridia bacterium]
GDSFKYDDGRYNTYDVKGLPPGPLCSPGIDAINAALYPTDSQYYYFVTDSSGNFYYHKTSAEQANTISKLQQGKQWIYEYFD